MGFWAEKKVLVTGGGGFVGSNLVDRLLLEGAQVRVTGRSIVPKRLGRVLQDIEYVSVDLQKIKNCKATARGMDVVFHLASVVAGIGYK